MISLSLLFGKTFDTSRPGLVLLDSRQPHLCEPLSPAAHLWFVQSKFFRDPLIGHLLAGEKHDLVERTLNFGETLDALLKRRSLFRRLASRLIGTAVLISINLTLSDLSASLKWIICRADYTRCDSIKNKSALIILEWRRV